MGLETPPSDEKRLVVEEEATALKREDAVPAAEQVGAAVGLVVGRPEL